MSSSDRYILYLNFTGHIVETVLVLVAIILIWRVVRRMNINHSIRTELAEIAGLGQSLSANNLSPGAKDAICRLMAESAGRALVKIDHV